MKLRLIGFSSVAIASGVGCIGLSVFLGLGYFSEIFSGYSLLFIFCVIGIIFILFGIWDISLIRAIESDERVQSENTMRIKSLEASNDKSRVLIEDQLRQLKVILEDRSRLDQWYLENNPSAKLTFFLNGKISQDYSSACLEYFGADFSKKNIYEVLYEDVEDQKYFAEWLSILPGTTIPFSDLAGLTDEEVALPDLGKKRGKPRLKYLQYVFCPIYSDVEKLNLERVAVFVSEITKSKKTSIELQEKEAKLEFILSILRDRNRYIKFLETCYQCVNDVAEISNSIIRTGQEGVETAFRLVHTVRGNAAAFGVRSLRDEGDKIEKFLIQGREGEVAIDEEYQRRLKVLVPELKAALVYHIDETERIFGEAFDPLKASSKNYNVSESFINEFKQVIGESLESPQLKELLIRKLKEIDFVKIKKFFLPYSETVQQLASRQGKKIAPLIISGGDLLIDPKALEPFFAAFIHLIINAVDHGIELPADRLEGGKAEEALLRLRAQANDGGLYISVEDDGRGLDLDLIAEKALQKNLITKNHLRAMSMDQILGLIFKEGFSTSRRITSVSGRGVGMSAVKHEVDRLGGTIKVNSKKGKSTVFTIFLPVEAV